VRGREQKKMSLQDLKIYFFNASALSISMTNVDVLLKLVLLIVTIGYTVHKWYIMNENRKNGKRDL
jgi:hypothetical protein